MMEKINKIRKKFEKAKELLKEYSMLDTLRRSMIRSAKERPEDLPLEEGYYDNVCKRIGKINEELHGLFK